MAKTVVGLYDRISQARAVVAELQDAGYERDQISLVANASAEEYGRYFDDEGRYRSDIDYDDHDEMTSGEGAAAGAGIGATVGGLGGLLMGLGLLAVPGVGPALAAGPIVSALVGAGIGAAAGGLMGALVNNGVPEEEAGYYAEGVRRGGSLVMLKVDDDQVTAVETIMNRHDPVDIEERTERWREEGFEIFDAEAEPYTAEQVAAERERYSVPVVEEEVAVGKRQVERGGVEVTTRVVEEPVEETVSLRSETVKVERHAVDRPVSDADRAFEERTVSMTETDEEAVVDKRARVVEEVEIGKDVAERTETVRDTVRRTEVEVHDIDSSARVSDEDIDVNDFRTHYDRSFANSGRTYEVYDPAYRFGASLARERGTPGDWNTLEADARRRWEERNPGTWDDYREAVRYSYEKDRNHA